MKSLRLRLVGALGLALFPVTWDGFELLTPTVHAAAPAKPSARTWSRSKTVRLPIQLDDRVRTNLSEIKLFVKTTGPEWVLVQSAPPSQTSFDYRAEKDGECSFMFVMVDMKGRSNPANFESRPPHQVIVVDTTPPELSVMPLPIGNRGIFLQCQVRDENPDLTSVKAEYLVDDNDWRPLELAGIDMPGIFKIPQPNILEGKVRVSAKDKAGNSSQRVIDLGDPTKSFVVQDKPAVKPLIEVEPQILHLPDAPEPTAGRVSAKLAEPNGRNDFESYRPVNGYNPNRPKQEEPARLAKADATDPVSIPEVAPAIVDPKTVDAMRHCFDR